MPKVKDLFQQPLLLAQPCRHCGAIEVPLIGEGAGPHAAKAICPHCQGFIKWLPRRLVQPQPVEKDA